MRKSGAALFGIPAGKPSTSHRRERLKCKADFPAEAWAYRQYAKVPT